MEQQKVGMMTLDAIVKKIEMAEEDEGWHTVTSLSKITNKYNRNGILNVFIQFWSFYYNILSEIYTNYSKLF